ncbi:4613_t:CDS:2 [Paraglomus brasilianum]|uniref:4613_t:CDS:1 n=1 Tax=Paraglomus brasilianum TaxID=144538 RepID=A0A9N9BSB9_9GLOM|nr:4613_t:CDS:2 [Paraglomus brasilianum]
MSKEKFEDLELLQTQLSVSLGLIRSTVNDWLPPPKPGEEEEEDVKDDTDELLVARGGSLSNQGLSVLVGKRIAESRLKRKLTATRTHTVHDNYNSKESLQQDVDDEDEDSKTLSTASKRPRQSGISVVNSPLLTDISQNTKAENEDQINSSAVNRDFFSLYITAISGVADEQQERTSDNDNNNEKDTPIENNSEATSNTTRADYRELMQRALKFSATKSVSKSTSKS